MIQALKSYIDRTTMYELMLQYLLVLLAAALLASSVNALSETPGAILWSTIIIVIVAWSANEILAWFFGAIANVESSVITALILALILPPVSSTDTLGTVGLILITLIAIGSKYVIALWKKHLFNPVAFAVVISAFVLNLPATWWAAGNEVLLPFIVIGGLMIVYKLRRFDLFFSFLIAALATVAFTSRDLVIGIQGTVLHSSLFFLAFVMLTEPLTMPPTRGWRIWYGALVGVLVAPAAHIGSFYFSPELALVAGNLFSFIVSPKGRSMLTLLERREIARSTYEFIFRTDRRMHFSSGQYLEWTLGDVPLDMRGNRRFFTIASAPENETVALGMRLYDLPSAFKRTLTALPVGGVMSAGSLAGDFTLPKDTKRKLCFIAGGIGVTPFASMARHTIASEESRDVVLLYSNHAADEIAYQNVFAHAARFGLRTVYALERITGAFIQKEIPDYNERLFYISGPPSMVSAMKGTLLDLGVSRRNIKTDYFPGLA